MIFGANDRLRRLLDEGAASAEPASQTMRSICLDAGAGLVIYWKHLALCMVFLPWLLEYVQGAVPCAPAAAQAPGSSSASEPLLPGHVAGGAQRRRSK